MDLRQLAVLVAVADHRSFSEAAKALHTVQSNVSTHVARLERELGATLVDRATGQPTEAGEVVVARARRIEAELESLSADVASLHDHVSGTVRLGTIGTTARWLVPGLMEAMLRQHPKVRLVVVDATTSSLLPRLAGGQLDLAIVNLPLEHTEIEFETLFTESTILLVPPDHPLREHDRVPFAALDQIPLLLEPRGTSFRGLLDSQADATGITLDAHVEVDGMRLLASLAFQGFGATLVPSSAAPRWIPGDWKRIEVDGLAGRSVGLAQRRRNLLAAPARALREVLREVIAAQAPRQPGIELPESVRDATSAR